jgi:hypothetical protein
VLDVGGATGHQALAIRRVRPDIHVTVTDVSAKACEAARQFGLSARQESVHDLRWRSDRCHAVICSDVLYYDPDIDGSTWGALSRVVASSGVLIIRGPNRAGMIRRAGARQNALATRLPWFNPEHLYVFTRSYLKARLTEAGLHRVRTLPSPIGRGSRAARFAGRIACGLRLPITPSLVTLARKP